MYWSALLFGLLGSFHCVGMCGPIVLSVPGKSVSSKLLYNLGRTLTYGLMGGLFGLIGEGFTLFGWQQLLSVIVGVLMLTIVIFTRYKHFNLPVNGVWARVWQYLKGNLAPLFKSRSIMAPFLIGLINGLLPCGFVYAALFTAVSLGGVIQGAIYMVLFGLGTAPLLISLSIFGNLISPLNRAKFNRLVPYFLGIVAILLILRGLNLGIPLVSPKLDKPGEMKHTHSAVIGNRDHQINWLDFT